MLNPFRESLSTAGREAQDDRRRTGPRRNRPFRASERPGPTWSAQVKRGDLTVKVARERAEAAATEMRDRLLKQAEGYSADPSGVPRPAGRGRLGPQAAPANRSRSRGSSARPTGSCAST